MEQTDPAGLQTLEHFSEARNFNRWMFDSIRPWCKGHVLEVGSGIGNLSTLFLEEGFTLTASDLREEYCIALQKKFRQQERLKEVIRLDLIEEHFEQVHATHLQQYDTIVALNVVEHIGDAAKAIRNCQLLLKPGGHLVILVPAFQFLFNSFDKELGHFLRYTKRRLNALLQQQGLQPVHSRYFNAAGILGWFLNGHILKKKIIPANQLILFDKLVPVFKLVDAVLFHSAGLSVIAVTRKPS